MLLEVDNLTKYFPVKRGFFKKTSNWIKAVDGVTFSMKEGITFGLVGESGCGKSTIARCILRLIEPSSGNIRIDGEDILHLNKSEIKEKRKKVQIVFQDPFASLNPRMRVESIVGEPMIIHNTCSSKKEREARVAWLLEKVGITSKSLKKYPHEFSGGQRQRIGIARALSLSPELIVADEPVSALDVSVRAQVINLFLDLQKEFNLSYLFITHDLSLINYISDAVAVMYLGKIVEIASSDMIFNSPLHPYTECLLSAVPVPDPKAKAGRRIVLEGDIPSPINPPKGCYFHTRCPKKMPICKIEEPLMREIKKGHSTACHLLD